MTRALLAIAAIAALLLLGAAIWFGAVTAARHHRFTTERNRIKLRQIEQQAELDMKLTEWQHVRSLEDIERQRQRLEGNLDDLHRDIDLPADWRDQQPRPTVRDKDPR